MEDKEYNNIKRTILRKMLRHEYIGGKHTSIENLPKGFPEDSKGKVKGVIKKMISEGYFIVKKKPDSQHVSLNPRRLPEIIKELEVDLFDSENNKST